MKALVAGEVADGYLDYHRRPAECRVDVLGMWNLKALEDLYFVRARSLRMVRDYVREIGVRNVARKVRSRMAESARNEKFLSVGIGRVQEAGSAGGPPVGALVAFVATSHPAWAERLCLEPALLRPLTADPRPDGVGPLHGATLTRPPRAAIDAVAGWHADSGLPLAPHAPAVAELCALTEVLEWSSARPLRPGPPSAVAERQPPPARAAGSRPAVALFGYGNYAKTHALPSLGEHLEVRVVHEIDPLQLPRKRDGGLGWDTAPVPRPDDACDAWMVAGYHASHAALAVRALDAGSSVILEKPLATDEDQLEALLAAMDRSTGGVFACFQRRYSELTRLAVGDLGADRGVPVSYHCIVHEVPLPDGHWYRWPASRSRLVSNGCHWVDHFLFLNGYADVVAAEVHAARNGALNCSVELGNGAVFSMALSDQGSSRIGVQDYVELRAEDRTARIVNDSRYVAESNGGVLRRSRQRKTASYERMYTEIARRIAEGAPGDSAASVRASGGVVLGLEHRLEGLRAADAHRLTGQP